MVSPDIPEGQVHLAIDRLPKQTDFFLDIDLFSNDCLDLLEFPIDVQSPPSSPSKWSSPKSKHEWFCLPCKKAFSSEMTLKTHEATAKHKNALRSFNPSAKEKMDPEVEEVFEDLELAQELMSENIEEALNIFHESSVTLWRFGHVQDSAQCLWKAICVSRACPAAEGPILRDCFLGLARLLNYTDMELSIALYIQALQCQAPGISGLIYVESLHCFDLVNNERILSAFLDSHSDALNLVKELLQRIPWSAPHLVTALLCSQLWLLSLSKSLDWPSFAKGVFELGNVRYAL